MIITADNNYRELDNWLADKEKVLLVCDMSIQFLDKFNKKLEEITVPMIRFSDFQPNPLYESVVEGVKLLREEGCDSIIAVGGGSAMDVAKCIKLYCRMDGNGEEGSYLKQTIIPNDIPFLVMPTTAGTGSEATRFAVIYYNGAKQSITHESIIPKTVLMDSSLLKTLPLYQRKCTMLDSLCHSVESIWSVNSTGESKAYASEAIHLILDNMDGYLANDDEANLEMLMAAYKAGKAINITQTTAGHAMCYKLTSLYGLAHGHSAMLCVKSLFPWILENMDKCIDPRGEDYLKSVMDYIAETFGYSDPHKVCEYLEDLYSGLNMSTPEATEEEFILLASSVNVDRLKNHPIALDRNSIDLLYHKMLGNT